MRPDERLYFADAALLDFDARVVETRPLADGVGVVLDRTAFYPTSGGQPHDTGTLDGEPVLDVFEAEDGAVVHRVARAPAGERVHGTVDGERRRDHMQQHSGQHLLSATVLALAGRDTLGFHLGRERCSIDIEGTALDAATLSTIERRTNEIVWEARVVTSEFVAAGTDPALRKPPPAGDMPLRVVEIAGWDRNACCGTHVARTSEIGLVKLLGQEKLGRGTRLHFVCGARALELGAREHGILDAVARARGCGAETLADNVAQLENEVRALHKQNAALRAQLAAFEAAAWIAAAERPGGVALVCHAAAEADAVALRAWADALVAQGAVALLGARAPRPALLFAAPDAVGIDLRAALEPACAAIAGKGGGPPGRVQAAGTRADGIEPALHSARAIVAALLAARGGNT
jgi:alanyl-tRNA synthetase